MWNVVDNIFNILFLRIYEEVIILIFNLVDYVFKIEMKRFRWYLVFSDFFRFFVFI